MKKENKILRSEQVNVNVNKELLENLKKLASIDGVTVSYKAYQIIKQYLDEHENEIKAYDEFLAKLKRK